ncbi:Hypothetical protein PHPALM_12932 [Phytophthora palmivora]|uniref:Uncharacterized protein n=1 Tax=Phytophthora palmivora TaxID=4796 RepID=A0A2P4XYH7_9STRA|nr:Hypothetical protein PHPALM_12932 [Phytophthora palmivora]
MVRIQILEAKNLRRILKRRTRIESMEEVCGVKGVKKLLKDTSTDNQHIFQRLLLEADQLYIGVDNVFSSKGFEKMPYTGYVRATNVDIVDGVYYEMSQRRLFPFSLLATENAVWECLRRLGMNSLHGVGASNAHVNVHPFAIVEEGNTLRSSFFTVISGTGDHIGNMNWKVARRYKDAGRTTFTCRIVSESTFQGGESSFSSTYTMQIVMNKTAEDADVTTVMIYFSAERATLPPQDDPVTQIACAAWDKHIPRFPIDVESVLLDSIYNTSDD